MDERVYVELKELKALVLELVKQGAVHNKILSDHEQRSTQLEGRVVPLENDLVFRHKLYTLIMGSSGLLAIISIILTLLK